MEEVLIVEGEEIDLQCNSNGVPKPSIFWSKNGIPVNLSDHLKV